MPRRVFFSFHYERDVWRASQIRNSWVTKPNTEAAGFWDAASWEAVRRDGEDAVKAWISRQLDGTSVTVVLIGYETHARHYVLVEIMQSHDRGNGLLGIYIHGLADQTGRTDSKGGNPFDQVYVENNGQETYLSQLYPTYDWVQNNGYHNLGDWIEEAARKAGR